MGSMRASAFWGKPTQTNIRCGLKKRIERHPRWAIALVFISICCVHCAYLTTLTTRRSRNVWSSVRFCTHYLILARAIIIKLAGHVEIVVNKCIHVKIQNTRAAWIVPWGQHFLRVPVCLHQAAQTRSFSVELCAQIVLFKKIKPLNIEVLQHLKIFAREKNQFTQAD